MAFAFVFVACIAMLFIAFCSCAELVCSPPYPPNPLSTPAGAERESFIWWFDKNVGPTGAEFCRDISTLGYTRLHSQEFSHTLGKASQMVDLDALIRTAEQNLNDSYRHLEELPNEHVREFVELKLQACIFQYDMCAELASVVRNQPSGFTSCVALKGLVLRLFEYDLLLNKELIPRFLKLAQDRGINLDRSDLRTERKKWNEEFLQLQRWADVRNQAAGHYGRDLTCQVELLNSLNHDLVMTVAQGFLSFNMTLLMALKSADKP